MAIWDLHQSSTPHRWRHLWRPILVRELDQTQSTTVIVFIRVRFSYTHSPNIRKSERLSDFCTVDPNRRPSDCIRSHRLCPLQRNSNSQHDFQTASHSFVGNWQTAYHFAQSRRWWGMATTSQPKRQHIRSLDTARKFVRHTRSWWAKYQPMLAVNSHVGVVSSDDDNVMSGGGGDIVGRSGQRMCGRTCLQNCCEMFRLLTTYRPNPPTERTTGIWREGTCSFVCTDKVCVAQWILT